MRIRRTAATQLRTSYALSAATVTRRVVIGNSPSMAIAASRSAVPLAAKDIVYARKLLSVIGVESGATPVSSNAPIVGAAGMAMTLAVCPPGQGPELHAHVKTYETFTVLRGRFEVRWNEPFSIGIDTGAVYGGRLTALRMPDETLFQV